MSPPSEAEAEVVDLVRALIRFDTSNTGDLATTKGEAECARWVAEQLQEVGYETEYIEAGAPGRANVFTRLKGADPSRGALMLHGHLDVVPAEASDWSVHPFSGALEDGYVWGRGAIDMKDMVGMMIAVARHFKRAGIVPPRDLVFAFLSDEEAGRQVRLPVVGGQAARPVRGSDRGDRRGRRLHVDGAAPRGR